jgi:UDP-3-O-[3-hydroxymyristoyl] glucosamine N-acyltransferase
MAHFTLAQLAEKVAGRVCGDSMQTVSGVNSLAEATESDISFLATDKHESHLSDSRAAAVLVTKEIPDTQTVQIVVANVDTALVTILNLFAPSLTPMDGIHPSAVIESSAKVAGSVTVGPHVYIGHEVEIGENSMIAAGCSIGERSRIGAHTRLDANVVVYHDCRIGNHCILMAGTSIGATGFGYRFIDGQHRLIPHNGGVILEDCVELGSNCCVDRAKFGNTIVGAGTKVDNLVQIGHNVTIGKCCIVVASAAIGGSAQLGNGVVIAGQVGVADNVRVGDGVKCGAQAGIIADVPPGKTLLGSPAGDYKQQMKAFALFRHLPEMSKQLKSIVRKLEKLEAAKDH